MEGTELTTGNALISTQGSTIVVGLGLVLLAQASYAKVRLVKSTHDFLIAGRKLGLEFSVANLLSGWTWIVGILMSIAVVYSFGLSGLWWFTISNGAAVVTFAKKLKSLLPHGYTISKFTLLSGTAAIQGAVLVSLILSVASSKMNARAFTRGTIAAIAIGVLCRFLLGELISTTTIVLVSAVVPSIPSASTAKLVSI